MSTLLLLATLLLSVALAGVQSAEWNYVKDDDHGPAKWGDDCNADDKNMQSPIDITASAATYKDLGQFSFKGYNEVDGVFSNKGHTVQDTCLPATDALMGGGGLGATFKLAQFHFHWGSTDSKGSEHMVGGKQFPMEVHFVHYNTNYEDLNTAAAEEDGLAVLGFFFEVAEEDNKAYSSVFQACDVVKNSTSATSALPALKVASLMGNTSGKYYRYQGSLTTPPCSQSVTWTVFDEPIKISAAQMEVIRDVSDDDGRLEYDNFRPPQSLGGRKVITNQPPPGWTPSDAASAVKSSMALTVVLAGLVGMMIAVL